MNGMIEKDEKGRFTSEGLKNWHRSMSEIQKEERIKKIAEKLRGQKRSPEQIKRNSEAQKKYWSQSTRGHDELLRRSRIGAAIGKLRIGDKNPRWKGGHYTQKNGYICILINPKVYVLEHRFLMEKHLGRKLNINEEVHHRNGIKDDNRIENLEIVVKKMHFGNVDCPFCKQRFKVK